ncbi:segregation/condensation protein A [Candidatus Pacearchaeota archaeon]|nr:segregation/condensation protein A [Candidatus Pacearchaeota archaeon]
MEEEVVKEIVKNVAKEKVGQEQIHDLLFDNRLSWQAIIYDLINSEQLDPWDIDLSVLSIKYIERVRMLEEANFFVSSKVLLAASLLLRLKSELLLSRDLQSLDDILYGKKEEKKYTQERISLDEDIPDLVPRTPLPRYKKVSLQELIIALGKAISTEDRRDRKALILKQHEMDAYLPIPKRLFNLQDNIKGLYSKIKQFFVKSDEKVAFSELSSLDPEERLLTFVSLLHLDNQQKVWLEQDGHFEEIWVLLKEIYESKNKDLLQRLKEEVEALESEREAEIKVESVSGFSEAGKE